MSSADSSLSRTCARLRGARDDGALSPISVCASASLHQTVHDDPTVESPDLLPTSA